MPQASLQEPIKASVSPDIFSYIDSLASVLLLILTLVSVICAFKAYRHQKERAKKEAACQLAKTYADDILPTCQIISNVFIHCGLLDFIKSTFPMDELSSFSRQEMVKIASCYKVSEEELQEKMENIDSLCILDVMTISTTSIPEQRMMNEMYSSIDPESHARQPKNSVFLNEQFKNTITYLLNTLEWFSMNCRYGLADEQLIYQSLHQTFLTTVWLLYYYICRNNISCEDKYYTNIIWLFKEWKKRLSDQAESAAAAKKRADESINEVLKEYENVSSYSGTALK